MIQFREIGAFDAAEELVMGVVVFSIGGFPPEVAESDTDFRLDFV